MKYQKMGSKRRTDLKIWPSEVKNVEESDSDVKKSLAPPKSAENNEKPKKKIRKKIENVKKSKIANRPKRALPKFRADRSDAARRRRTLGKYSDRPLHKWNEKPAPLAADAAAAMALPLCHGYVQN